MILLGIDFETDSVQASTCRPREIGVQTYCTETRKRGKAFSTMIWEKTFPPLTAEIEELTGITDAENKTGCSVEIMLTMLAPILKEVDILCAYNAVYDRTVMKRCYTHAGMEMPDLPWICAYSDWPYPKRMRCGQLSHRALDHGIKMDGRKLHRALADVTLMWDILDRYDPKVVLEYWGTPWVYAVAEVPKPWTDQGRGRDAAKAAGFGWEAAPGDDRKFPLKWVKRLKNNEPVPSYPFGVEFVAS